MRSKRNFSKECKLEAVRLAQQLGVEDASESLGIDKSMLYQWRKQLPAEGNEAFRGNGDRTALEEESRHLGLKSGISGRRRKF
jgi:transposase-like protein